MFIALLLFLVARFVALAEIRRFKSSRSNDFRGDTLINKKPFNFYVMFTCLNLMTSETFISDVKLDDDGALDSGLFEVEFCVDIDS